MAPVQWNESSVFCWAAALVVTEGAQGDQGGQGLGRGVACQSSSPCALALRGARSRPGQPDVAAKGFQVYPRAAVPDREGELPALVLAGQRHRIVRLEAAVERVDAHRGVRVLRHRDRHVTLVRGQLVPAAVLDGAIVGDVAVHGARLDAGRLDGRRASRRRSRSAPRGHRLRAPPSPIH